VQTRREEAKIEKEIVITMTGVMQWWKRRRRAPRVEEVGGFMMTK